MTSGKHSRKNRQERPQPTGKPIKGDLNPPLWIGSVRSLGPDGDPMCALTWGPMEWFAPAPKVITAAQDFMTCAAYAEVMTQMFRTGTDRHTVMRTMMGLMAEREDQEKKTYGCPDTVTMAPGGDSRRRQGLVLIKHGGMDGMYTPLGARTIARHWMQAAVGSISDINVRASLRDVLELPEDRIDAVFAWMLHLNTDTDLTLESFMQGEAERLRRMGLDPGKG